MEARGEGVGHVGARRRRGELSVLRGKMAREEREDEPEEGEKNQGGVGVSVAQIEGGGGSGNPKTSRWRWCALWPPPSCFGVGGEDGRLGGGLGQAKVRWASPDAQGKSSVLLSLFLFQFLFCKFVLPAIKIARHFKKMLKLFIWPHIKLD